MRKVMYGGRINISDKMRKYFVDGPLKFTYLVIPSTAVEMSLDIIT